MRRITEVQCLAERTEFWAGRKRHERALCGLECHWNCTVGYRVWEVHMLRLGMGWGNVVPL